MMMMIGVVVVVVMMMSIFNGFPTLFGAPRVRVVVVPVDEV